MNEDPGEPRRHQLFDAPLTEGRPPVLKPTEADPQPVVAWPGWGWWPDEKDGHPRARRAADRFEVRAHNFTTLLAKIRKAEGGVRGGGPDR